MAVSLFVVASLDTFDFCFWTDRFVARNMGKIPALQKYSSKRIQTNKSKEPPINELLKLPATTLSAMIKRKEVKVETLTRICIETLREKNKDLNAVVATRFIDATLEARKLDEYLESDDLRDDDIKNLPPLFGVPIVIKECFEMKDMPYTGGVVGRMGARGSKNSVAVQQAIDAGMIVIGSSNISEGCMFHESNNLVYGQTNNPYDFSRSPGGSSGGCAAICASGAVPLVICSDVGGSIRIPSFFCGLFGHKPSGGLVSNVNTYPSTGTKGVDRYCQLGPVARHACDLYPFLNALKKPSKRVMDPRLVDLKDITVFVVDKPLGSYILRSKLDPELKTAVDNVVDTLKDHVKSVKYTDMGKFSSAMNSFSWWGACMDTEKPEPFIETITEGLCNQNPSGQSSSYYFPTVELLYSLIGISSRHTMPAIGLGALEMIINLFPSQRRHLLQEFKAEKKKLTQMLNDENAVLLYPTLPSTAFYHHEGLIRFLDVGNTCIMNALEFPATNIPLGLSKINGMPLGVQCASPKGNDHKTISVAMFLEEQGLAYWQCPHSN